MKVGKSKPFSDQRGIPHVVQQLTFLKPQNGVVLASCTTSSKWFLAHFAGSFWKLVKWTNPLNKPFQLEETQTWACSLSYSVWNDSTTLN